MQIISGQQSHGPMQYIHVEIVSFVVFVLE